jgi:DNA helicase-2/ATP-dependent DNA helicase PcrA
MRERLTKLIGKQHTSAVKMGTFHALCALFLRKYGGLVGVDENFTICDADERYVSILLSPSVLLQENSKKLVSTSLKAYKELLEAKNLSLKEATVLSMISKAKAKGHTSAELLSQLSKASQDAKKFKAADPTANDVECLVAEIYEQYERILRRNNSLDFDDLLLFGVKLFTEHKRTVSWCKHILVDEL